MVKAKTIISDLDNLHKRPEHIKKRAKWIINFILFVAFPLVMLVNNAEVFLITACVIPFYFSSQYLFEGELTFKQRRIKMFWVTTKSLMVILLLVVIIENFLPRLSPILYFTFK
tara:strand:+ start:302 stop:643 length:342 start_codon:yes stop_codon:yes gene_type:complete